MSKLNVDQKTIYNLLSDKQSDFLIPDYQRPYAWDEEQCQTLWDDLFAFSFPDNDADKFDENEEYFLGAVVTFKNERSKLEVIDGQQRLTTLLLVLRAFYDKFANMQDENSRLTRERIEKCIWKTDKYGKIDKDTLKIDSEVATDNDKEEFLELLKTGVVPAKIDSQYVKNYNFFHKKIDEFLGQFPGYFADLPANILNNCILLPIEAESQDTALRIFSTLNDRGLPLSDSDIFKAQFYKYYGDKNEKDIFIERWKKLEEITSEIFSPISGTPMDDLFTKYMYYLRAKQGIKSSTTEALRKFYERDKYQALRTESTMDNLELLADFWDDIKKQDQEVFTVDVLKKLYVLNYAPNGMWEFVTSVYFLQNKDDKGRLDNERFAEFLQKITTFIFAYAITNPGVNALRTPIYEEMINLVEDKPVRFERHKFNLNMARSAFENYVFTNNRNITRSMVTWYAFSIPEQQLISLDEKYDVEHIFAKKRQEMEKSLSDNNLIEKLGNKVLLETSINIRASDYRFEDKKKIYTGEMRRGKNKQPTKINELLKSITKFDDFIEHNIVDRDKEMLDKFFESLKEEGLIAE
jgi:hypothetical protein